MAGLLSMSYRCLIFTIASTCYDLHTVYTANCSYDYRSIRFDPPSVNLELGESRNISIHFEKPLPCKMEFKFTYRDNSGAYFILTEHLPIKPLDPFTVRTGSNATFNSTIHSNSPGVVELGLNSSSLDVAGSESLHQSITVERLRSLTILQQIIGWSYFLAWTMSFYPQIVLNFQRKSVTGLSFDFIVFNAIGFFCYSAFNLCLYFVPTVKEAYYKVHPLGEIPVQLNDIFFSVHALVVTGVLAIQCIVFERGTQKVSWLCLATASLMVAFAVVSSFLALGKVITWLTALYLLSYVKLTVTLVKYLPQAVLNSRRKSVVGWSIGNFILDFTGGALSIAQMFIIAYNRNDWSSVIGSPTKFGLGLVSIAFDCIFFAQHSIYSRLGRHLNSSTIAEAAAVQNDPETTVRNEETAPLLTAES